jgi:hypothetical protein
MPQTTNYSWNMPEPGGSGGVWGTILNIALQAIDTVLKAVSDVANAALPKTGGELTGNIKILSDTYTATALGEVSGATAVNLALGRFFSMTVTGATTLALTNAPATGTFAAVVLEITNGGANVTWPSSVKWPEGELEPLTAAGVYIVTLYTRDGGTTWRAAVSMLDSK